jgi:hypothetical protein
MPMSDDPVPPDHRDHSFERGGGGFVPVLVAAGLLASAVLLALE